MGTRPRAPNRRIEIRRSYRTVLANDNGRKIWISGGHLDRFHTSTDRLPALLSIGLILHDYCLKPF
jgi:hypothetical protein